MPAAAVTLPMVSIGGAVTGSDVTPWPCEEDRKESPRCSQPFLVTLLFILLEFIRRVKCPLLL